MDSECPLNIRPKIRVDKPQRETPPRGTVVAKGAVVSFKLGEGKCLWSQTQSEAKRLLGLGCSGYCGVSVGAVFWEVNL